MDSVFLCVCFVREMQTLWFKIQKSQMLDHRTCCSSSYITKASENPSLLTFFPLLHNVHFHLWHQEMHGFSSKLNKRSGVGRPLTGLHALLGPSFLVALSPDRSPAPAPQATDHSDVEAGWGVSPCNWWGLAIWGSGNGCSGSCLEWSTTKEEETQWCTKSGEWPCGGCSSDAPILPWSYQMDEVPISKSHVSPNLPS